MEVILFLKAIGSLLMMSIIFLALVVMTIFSLATYLFQSLRPVVNFRKLTFSRHRGSK